MWFIESSNALSCACGRDAWNSLGEMSKESAMAAYVDEMKKVAQEVCERLTSFIYFSLTFLND